MRYRLRMGARVATAAAAIGMIIGCGASPVAPTARPSTETPIAAVAVTSVAPSFGPAEETTAILVFGSGFLPGATVSLDGISVPVREVTSTVITATAPVHAPGSVDVVVTNPDGQSATLVKGFSFGTVTVTVTATRVIAGDPLVVSWTAPGVRPTSGGGDWVSIFKVGASDSEWGWFEHLNGQSSGTVTLKAPSQPGEYEVRYMIGGNAAARSRTVTVIPAGSV